MISTCGALKRQEQLEECRPGGGCDLVRENAIKSFFRLKITVWLKFGGYMPIANGLDKGARWKTRDMWL